MPSVVLSWTGNSVKYGGCEWHSDNDGFWKRAHSAGASIACIDGPCDTNGLRVLPDWASWDPDALGGVRDGERALAAAGVGLFWTTYRTVTRFDGASRWIARSLRLFGDEARAAKTIETHPHGAFTFLWRSAGRTDVLGKKTSAKGRENRAALLRSLVPDMDEANLPDHDAIDAAAAAVVAVLHGLGRTVAFGTDIGGGRIWMPSV